MDNTQCAADMSNMTPDEMNQANPNINGYSMSGEGTTGSGIGGAKVIAVVSHLNGSSEMDKTEIINELSDVGFATKGGRPC